MKKLTTQILSIILTLSIAFSLAVPAFAASNTSAYQNIAPEDIASIQETRFITINAQTMASLGKPRRPVAALGSVKSKLLKSLS